MHKRYLGRLILNNDNINVFHKYIEAYKSIDYYVTKVKTNKAEYDNYNDFKDALLTTKKLKTIHITFSRKEEKLSIFNKRFNTRVWYYKENINEEWDPNEKKNENHTFYSASKGLFLFKEKMIDTYRGKDMIDLLWIMPLVGIVYIIVDGTVGRIWPFIIMISLYLFMKIRLSMYHVVKLK